MTIVHAEGGPLGEPLVLAPGDVVLLRGPNGAGKTSLLRALAGLPSPLPPARVRVGAADPRELPADALARAVAFAPQEARDGLAGLTVAGEARLRGRAPPAAVLDLAGHETARLSSGEARRVVLALATASPTPLLLLDEPSEGLDPRARGELRRAILAHRETGAVVLADHGGALDDLATRVVRLGAEREGGWPELGDAPAWAPVLEAPPCRVARDGGPLDLPAIRMGPGVHAVVGPNGAGKSTLLRRLANVEGPGDARVNGALATPGRDVRLLLAEARDHLFRETVDEELRGADPAVVDALVPPGLRARHPLALSGGETRRVALAKCLGRPAPVLLLDEPEAHLDAAGRLALGALLGRRAREGACILVATHDAALAARAHSRLDLGGA